ncbi:uncharacterized protein LOC107615181 [Arachis ipaensis]|uniref:uncharacterized protein LOC107615181 n=1 Tax=Arachis ipaensis TaxID=130454 RepID=UPI0007AF7B21|nr:uncharacterized protein LOC107615181 [Arachis ipaensis]XP_025678220.1 uncharacterized protein LOC112778068 [Arachis hypogaea]
MVDKFSTAICNLGFTCSPRENALFIRKSEHGVDLLLFYFLGLEVLSIDEGIYLSQAKYASDLVARAGIIDSHIESTSLEPNVRFIPIDSTVLDNPTLYRQLVGGLVCLTVTRPDIAYPVHVLMQFLSSPRSIHYAAVLHIIRYIKGTLFHGLHFSAHSSLSLQAYSNVD